MGRSEEFTEGQRKGMTPHDIEVGHILRVTRPASKPFMVRVAEVRKTSAGGAIIHGPKMYKTGKQAKHATHVITAASKIERVN